MRRSVTFLFLFISCFALNLHAQDSKKFKFNFSAGADFMSRYIWRGLNLGGPGPSIQPSLKAGLGNSNHEFSLGAWGAYTFSATSNEELDLIVSYTYKKMLTVMVTDYFFPGLYSDKRDDYFYYRQDSTGHVYEGCVSFNGTEKIPVTLMICVNLYGNDARRLTRIDDSTYNDDGLMYSTYLELGFKKSIRGFDFSAWVGGTLNTPDTDNGEKGYYANTRPGITTVGVKLAKGIPVTEKFSIPVQAALIANPMQKKMYLVCGISFFVN